MANVCDICNLEFATPAALGSHKRKHKAKQEPKVSSSEPVTVRLVVEQANPQKPYTCPECGSNLAVMADGAGTYKLKCPVCWAEK